MKDRNKNTNTKSELVSKLTKEDGQSEKLEEKRIKVKKGSGQSQGKGRRCPDKSRCRP